MDVPCSACHLYILLPPLRAYSEYNALDPIFRQQDRHTVVSQIDIKYIRNRKDIRRCHNTPTLRPLPLVEGGNSPYLAGQNIPRFHKIELNAPEKHLLQVFWMFSILCHALKGGTKKR